MIVVYYCTPRVPPYEPAPQGVVVDSQKAADELVRQLRQQGALLITIARDPLIQVGADDVGGIVQDGKLPDGSDYTWKKRRP